jgi:hypothetical protein
MAGGNDYRDMFSPVEVLDQGVITLATTQKALWTAPKTLLPANFWKVGKTMKLTAAVKMVTDGTAGNYVFGAGAGTGDAPAVIVVGSSQASVTSKTFLMIFEAWFTCRLLGTAGTLSIWGRAFADLSGVLSTAQPYVFPTTGTTVVSTLDMTLATTALTFQAQRSGVGVYTATTVGLFLEAMN